MRIDLHTHSDRSDGTDSPTVLVEKARAAGLDVVALTDHDSVDGWQEAQDAADRVGIRLVRGLEISTSLQHMSVHLLAYEVDPDDGPLMAELRAILEGRNDRLPRTVAKLRALGIDLTEDHVRRLSGKAVAMGRPHVADALVDLEVVASREEAFDRYLKPGRPAYVDRYAVDLFEAVGLVKAAGGVAVVAHPWARGSHRVLTRDMLTRLAAAGLDGIEVDHEDHDAQSRERLRAIARELGLVHTGSSDHHGLGKVGFDLGCNLTAPEQLRRLLDR